MHGARCLTPRLPRVAGTYTLAQVWDLKLGRLIRTQLVHKGAVTSLVYASSVNLLFSGSIDGSIGVWGDKGALLQVRLESGQGLLEAWRRHEAVAAHC